MIKLTFLGDVFPGDELFTNGFGIKSKTNNLSVELWKNNIISTIGKADFIIGNLESPLIDDKDAKQPTFYGRTAFAEILKQSGINVLNIANNHILEHGVNGFKQTLSTLHCNGIQTIGEQKDGISSILTIHHDDTIICLAGFCDERVCNIENPQCYASLDDSKVMCTLDSIKALKPDIIIFVFHWGNEYIHIPSLEQRMLAQKLIDKGANLVIGHHPHVIQPYEQYNKGHIIYSLGNFCFDDVQSDHFGKGMIAQVSIKDRSIQDISFKGILVQDMAYYDELVKPMSSQDFDRYISHINDTYAHIRSLPNEEYQGIYQKSYRRAHLKERFLMRLNIIKKVTDPCHKHKKLFLTNIKNYILH